LLEKSLTKKRLFCFLANHEKESLLSCKGQRKEIRETPFCKKEERKDKKISVVDHLFKKNLREKIGNSRGL
jgi:hypothetical protein